MRRHRACLTAMVVIAAAALRLDAQPPRPADRAARPPVPRGPSAGPRPLLFGFALDCTRCTLIPGDRDPTPVWHYIELPRVAAVRPNGAAAVAGVQAGDTIVLVDSLSILSHEGARRFSTARPGARVRLTLRRAGRSVDAVLSLGRPPDPPPPVPTRTAQSRRYSGDVGNASVDVWSETPVSVTVDSTGALVIQTATATVRVASQRIVSPASTTRRAQKRPNE